jgi:glycosyltransferase involved in cell wall biosynthesis
MNIVILLPDAKLGGAQNVLLRLVEEFAKSHKVEICCLSKAGTLHESFSSPLQFRFLDSGARLGFFGAFKAFHALVGFMRNRPNATMLSTGTGTNLLACAARFFAPNGARLVIREACSSKNTGSRIIAFLKRFLYPSADGMIGVSDGVAGELQRLAGKRQPVASIPNPVDVQRLQALAEAKDERLSTFPRPYLLTVGRLVPQKNTALLVEAFAGIAGDVAEHLVIIGGGPLEAALREQIVWHGLQSRVHLLGEITNPHPWYKHASAFALTSDWEGYPNVLLEALAHGLPVVSTDCEFGPRQILDNNRFGHLVRTGDDVGMANSILKTMKGAMVFEAWDAERFNAPSIASRYLAFMESCRNGI